LRLLVTLGTNRAPELWCGSTAGSDLPLSNAYSRPRRHYHVIVASPIDTIKIAADSLVVLTAGEVRTIIAAPSQNQASGNLVIVRDAN
jgi:hypothetical protein